MTSKEALERIKKSHQMAMAMCCEGRKDEETEKAINKIEKDLDRLEELKEVVSIFLNRTDIEKDEFEKDNWFITTGWNSDIDWEQKKLIERVRRWLENQ